MSASLPNNYLVRLEAELRLRERNGDPLAIEYFRGHSAYQDDPVGFIQHRLGVQVITDPIKKVIESVRDNQVTIAVSANQVGKSHAAARIAVWFYKTYEDAQVYTTAAPPITNLQNILWGEIGAVVRAKPELFASDRVYNDMNIRRHSLSFITGVAIPSTGSPTERESKFSGKHAPHMLFIVDEGDAVPNEVYKGIDSCLSGGMGRLLIMFNPRYDSGAVAQMVKRKEGHIIHLSAFDHPNVIQGIPIVPAGVSREKTVERINKMTDPLLSSERPDIECFELPDYLVGASALDKSGNMTPPLPAGWRRVKREYPEFFYKVLGIYPPQSETQLISRAWIDSAVSRWHTYVARFGEMPPANVSPIIGLDVADGGRDKNSMCQRWGGWVAHLRTWGGVDPDQTAIKTWEISKTLNIQPHLIRAKVDGTGVGAGVAPRMQRLGLPYAAKVMVASSPTYKTEMGEFRNMRDQIWYSTMLWLKDDPGAMLPPDEELIEELLAPSYWVYNGKVVVTSKDSMKESLGRSPDKAESLILTFAPDTPLAY
jgi:phage terminase large subunit